MGSKLHLIDKCISGIAEKTGNVPLMEIIADGTQVNENPAACYRGLGCVTANNSSRLLLDYKIEHPKEYEEMMRLLFQKDYGVGLTHIKVELGADVNSSSGTEPATKRSADEPADVTRGAGFQFAADAKAINPDLTLDLLRWGEPSWVTAAFQLSQEHGLNARYRWYKETLDAAHAVYGLKFDFISADQSETDMADEAWILYLRYRLDHETNAPYDYSKIKLVASDEAGTRNIAAQMVENNLLRNAVDVIGLHYTTQGDSYTNLLNEAYGKEIWYSEGIAPCNMPEYTALADDCGIKGKNGLIDVANRIINSYYNGKMVMYEFQPAIAAYYDGACYAPKQLIRAWEPWSGHYVLDSGFWMAMHFNRFSPKGWMFVNGACYGDGEENHAITNTTSNFMTLVSPDRTELTMHFTNDSDTTRLYSVYLKDLELSRRTFSTVLTTGPSGKQQFADGWFQVGKPIRPSRKNSDMYLVKVPPYSLMTVTTLDTSWVHGIKTFEQTAPNSQRLPLPYRDDFSYPQEELNVRGCAPRYSTDQGGAFELVRTAEDETLLCQRISKQIIPTNWRFCVTPEPITCLGDDRWRSYSAEIEVKLQNMNAENYAALGIRYNSSVTCEYSSMCGYSVRLYGDGSWKLMDMDNVGAEGVLRHALPNQWNSLKLLVLGNAIFVFINGDMLTRYTPQCMINSGRISLASAYAWNMFRNLKVEPIPVLPLYVRRIDCLADGIIYDENWTVQTMEKYTFYHRTSMTAGTNAEFRCQFVGSGIAIIGTATDMECTVWIDGKPIYENWFLPSCAPRQACVIIDQLTDAKHELRMKVTSGAFQLDVLEIPEKHVLMPDVLCPTTAQRSAAILRDEQLQKELEKQEAEAATSEPPAAPSVVQGVSVTAVDAEPKQAEETPIFDFDAMTASNLPTEEELRREPDHQPEQTAPPSEEQEQHADDSAES